MNQFLAKELSDLNTTATGTSTWSSPSNIALVKYWGKHGVQLPANPSISFTLNDCQTTTTLKWGPRTNDAEDFEISFLFEGAEKPSFIPKIRTFFERILPYFPYLKSFAFKIESSNSFPHSSGIASSASGMSALALCLCSMEQEVTNPGAGAAFLNPTESYRKASFIARLGSGSACRSVYGGLVVWGEHENYAGSAAEYGTQFNDYHEVFGTYRDTILIADSGEKVVSSTVGHNLMHDHPFAAARFEKAEQNMSKIKDVLINGELDEFNKIVEGEALMLHAMMMTSDPYFLLFKPNTLQIIEKVWAFREEHDCHLSITLDAGANVHLLYPSKDEELAKQLIDTELVAYCQNRQYICDKVGNGPCQPTTNI